MNKQSIKKIKIPLYSMQSNKTNQGLQQGKTGTIIKKKNPLRGYKLFTSPTFL